MSAPANHSYLETEIMTATPQKLQLMLIDGAIRFCRQAESLWEEDAQAASEAMIRAQEIVGELLASVRTNENELTKPLAGIYVFVFRSIASAYAERKADALADALKVLTAEQETWRQVCEKFGAHRSGSAKAPALDLPQTPSSGFSLEA